MIPRVSECYEWKFITAWGLVFFIDWGKNKGWGPVPDSNVSFGGCWHIKTQKHSFQAL